MAAVRIGSVEIQTFPLPPEDFEPLIASAALLERHGFPPRPDSADDPYAAAKWVEAFSRYSAFRYITPEFRLLPDRHGPNQRLDVGTEANANAQSTIWSGFVIFLGGKDKFAQIVGTWSVPRTYSPTPIDAAPYTCAVWLGIDGDGSPDVLQAGTESDSDGSCYAWFEWFPASSVQITNFPVNPGDVMYLSLSAKTSTKASMGMWNRTSQIGTFFSFKAPAGTQLAGNCAEGIVERPSFNTNGKLTPSQLARFGEVFFDDVIAFTELGRNIVYPPGWDPRRHYLVGAGLPLDMVADDKTTVISTTSLEGSGDMFSCYYTGP